MFALLTLPRGIPIDPEARSAPDEGETPVGIIIRPGPLPGSARTPLRQRLAEARA